MNRQRLNDIATNTGMVTDADIAEIRQLIGKYPFYALPHTILAKIFYEKEHYLFENALTQAAMRVPDRAALYQYIHGGKERPIAVSPVADNNEAFAVSIDAVRETEMPVEQEAEAVTEAAHQPEVVKNDISEFLEEFSESNGGVETELVEGSEAAEAEALILEPQATLAEEVVDESLLSDEEIDIRHIHEPEPESETPDETPEAKPEPVLHEEVQEEDEAAINMAMNLRKHPVYSVEEFLMNSAEEKVATDAEPHDFFYWLQHPKKESEVAESKAEPESEPGPEPEPEPLPEPDKKLSIIDQFIRSNPAISRPKKEFYSAENMAKRSESMDMEFVSETLANIYYEQGNIDLAVKAYEKLSLQNPLKQAYFATLIEKIKKEKR